MVRQNGVGGEAWQRGQCSQADADPVADNPGRHSLGEDHANHG